MGHEGLHFRRRQVRVHLGGHDYPWVRVTMGVAEAHSRGGEAHLADGLVVVAVHGRQAVAPVVAAQQQRTRLRSRDRLHRLIEHALVEARAIGGEQALLHHLDDAAAELRHTLEAPLALVKVL